MLDYIAVCALAAARIYMAGSQESGSMVQRRVTSFFYRYNGRLCVYRCYKERFANNCDAQVDRFRGGNVTVRGAISYGGRSEHLVLTGSLTDVRYRNEILGPHVLPSLKQQRTENGATGQFQAEHGAFKQLTRE